MENNEEKKDNKIKEWSAKKTECNGIVNCLPLDGKNGVKLAPPQGCEVDKVEVVDGVLNITFKPQERKLPKSWEEFCDIFPQCGGGYYIDESSEIREVKQSKEIRFLEEDKNILPDRATASAVIALCQLIQLRNCYNGDWVPDWTDEERKYTIDFYEDEIWSGDVGNTPCILHFRSKDLRDEFLRNFRPLIEKLKPLYGIKEGGEE